MVGPASSEFIAAVGGTGRPFYTRLISNGLGQIPGLAEKLEGGAAVAELACGAGTGLIKFANAYPNCSVVGIDGDEFSLGLTRKRLGESGLSDRVDVQHSTFEGWSPGQKVDMIFINISMHECRDTQKTTQNVYDALNPGGIFVISDMPFPATMEECRTVPARVMCGIQFWEAQIDDQLLPMQDYVELFGDNGFGQIDRSDMTPVHAVVHGRKPDSLD